MLTFLCDLRYATRVLLKAPGLLLIAMISLGLGIGINTTIFGIFNSLFLQSPTVAGAGRVVRIHVGGNNRISFLNYLDLQDSEVFASLAVWRPTELNLRLGDGFLRLYGASVSESFFSTLGVSTRVGRTFSGGETNVAILSHTLWTRSFDGDPNILGRVLILNGQPFTAIGVLAANHLPVGGLGLTPQVYVPLSQAVAPEMTQRDAASLEMIGRLKAGIRVEQAQAAASAVVAELRHRYPDQNNDLKENVRFFPISGLYHLRFSNEVLIGFLFSTFLLVVVGLVLLIACTNIAGLLLARAVQRRGEMAVRLALGASRRRLVQHLLAESAVLAALGTAGGLLVSLWLGALTCSLLTGLPIPIELHLEPDWRLVLYTVAIAVFTMLACGLVPALQASRTDLVSGLKQQPDHFLHRRLRLRNILVVGQVTVSLVLLIASGLFLRSLRHIGDIELGFNVDRSAIAEVSFEQRRSKENAIRFLEEVIQRIDRAPGIVSSSIASTVPLSPNPVVTNGIQVYGRPPGPSPKTFVNSVGPRYFETLVIPLVRGREFRFTDRDGAPPVAIINETFTRLTFRGQDPIGQRIRWRESEPWAEIVGIVRDCKYGFPGEETAAALYRPYQQAFTPRLTVHVHTAGPPAAMLKTITAVINAVDNAAKVEAKTMQESMKMAFLPIRIGGALLGSAGVLGLLLVVIGLYGVMSHFVNRSIPEIGIRMALGAPRRSILLRVLADGLRLVGIGVTLGLTTSWVTTPLLSMFLTGVSPTDLLTFASVSLLLLLVGAVASFLAAYRATRVDPMRALRYE
jgi:putative ABC transport system permease protein